MDYNEYYKYYINYIKELTENIDDISEKLDNTTDTSSIAKLQKQYRDLALSKKINQEKFFICKINYLIETGKIKNSTRYHVKFQTDIIEIDMNILIIDDMEVVLENYKIIKPDYYNNLSNSIIKDIIMCYVTADYTNLIPVIN